MGIVLDVIFVAVLAIAFYTGFKRGFVKSLINFVGTIIALVVAWLSSGPIAVWIYDLTARQGLYDRIYESTELQGISDGIREIYDPLPDFVKQLMENAGVSEQYLQTTMSGSSDVVANAMVDAISPAFIAIISIVVFVIVFALLLVLVTALAKLVTPLVKVKFVEQVDKSIGGVFGALMGVIVVWILASFLLFVSFAIQPDGVTPVQAAIDDSLLVKGVTTISPIDWLN